MHSLIYIVLCFTLVAVCIKPLGLYMARVYMGERVWTHTLFGWLERLIYKACGIDPKEETGALGYGASVLMFGAAGFALLFIILIMQKMLPLNPLQLEGLSSDMAFNVAVSFITNTNWQSYSGEVALSAFSQMMGLAVQNFLSAATGMAVAAALFRALGRKQASTIGNFWVDMVRSVLYILLPMSLVFALFLASQGVVQTFDSYITYSPVEATQESLIAMGPAASQVAIKMLGSNGGGFFNANAAHPFENPTALANLLQIVSILLIPAALTYTFGSMVGDRRQGWSMLATMVIIFLPLLWLVVVSEHGTNPRFDTVVVDQSAGNMEGKEVRFGATSSALWAAATTATSNGSVNAMHDSFTPLGGLVPLMLIQFGEVVFGGVGSGMYSMLMTALLTVFIAGLMVGRTPEYLGKKLGTYEIKMAALVTIIPSAAVLLGAALAIGTDAGRAGILNPGAQGFSEVLYAYSSAGNNNGSAFAGLNASSAFYNITLGIAMLIGRYGVILPVLAIAGALAARNTVPRSLGTLPTHTPLFVSMLVLIVVLISVLTYIPALALGPIAEHVRMTLPWEIAP